MAFLVAPALCPLAGQAFALFLPGPRQVEAAGIDLMLTLAASYAMALLAGIPMHEYLQRKRWVALPHYVNHP